MGLSIKNPRTEELVRRLVAATGESVTKAIEVSVSERLERIRTRKSPEERLAALQRISKESGARWTSGITSTNHGDFLYDERGLPK